MSATASEHEAARLTAGHFLEWVAGLQVLTRRARSRFVARDWLGGQRDSVERFAVYRRSVERALADLAALPGPPADHCAWRRVRDAYAAQVQGRGDHELALTFYNSVVRRALGTVGVDAEAEFVDLHASAPAFAVADEITDTLPRHGRLDVLLRDVLVRHSPGAPWDDLEGDALRGAAALVRHVPDGEVRALEVVRSVFYRNKGAYIVGRVLGEWGSTPLVLALLNPAGGMVLDAVLAGEDEVSAVFSFTRSYFFVETDHPRGLVGFLHALLPRKPIGELYNAIGYDRHGKTELFRALRRHIEESAERFVIAPGARGMVMLVFTMPYYDVVFKVIRDRFDYPKNSSRREVMDKYQLVSEHDRAGRLVDAQEFRDLQLDRERFDQRLLRELEANAAQSVAVGDRTVVLRHLYTERKLVPLDIYLRRASPELARLAVLDYGTAVRDLAATNIFPGDLLLKNFGVTRLGRVVFYDYDELCLVTDCRFRELPQPRDDEEETAGEAWFYVGEKDVFPEEFITFLGFPPPLRALFVEAHADLLTPAFWIRMQEEHRAGHVLDIFPYRQELRLRRQA